MPTLPTEASGPSEDLLRAVERLDTTEFSRFFSQLLALRARREAPAVPASEALLIQQINEGLPATLQSRYDRLIARRQAGTLSAGEQAELITLSDQVEALEARRATALAELARLRGVTLSGLMSKLGISASPHG